MTHLAQVQQWLRRNRLHGLLVPSTDEFLSEWTPPHLQRLKWVTGFSGSVGLAIVLQDKVALCVDGRYALQARTETEGSAVEILPLTEAARNQWLAAHVKRGERLALDPAIHAVSEVETLRTWAREAAIELVLLDRNPIDELWREDRPIVRSDPVVDHPERYAGQSSSDKRAEACRWLTQQGLDGYLIADPQDLAWLLNVRSHQGTFVPVCLSYGLLETSGRLTWGVDRERLALTAMAHLGEMVDFVPPAQFAARLAERTRGKTIGAHFRRTPFKLAQTVRVVGTLRHDAFIERHRWIKHPSEIEGARRAHHLDGQAVIRFLAWLENAVLSRDVTELEAAGQLTALRKELPEYHEPSMPSMSASGPNSALPHYVPEQHSNRVLNRHPIYWIDSGGQYASGTTDNTVCIALGDPEPRHKLAHTLVLKGFIALAKARFPAGTLASQLDSLARQYLWREGRDYPHGTGHGVGNVMNIHEGPVIGKYHIHSPLNVPIEAGMIISNEPAYYLEGDFGVRIESHLLVVPSTYEGFLEFETLSRLPIDPRLVEVSLLTEEERHWLSDYHRRIRDDCEGRLEVSTALWLQDKLDSFIFE